ncbi:MAG: hypothetical protein D6714_00465 [Bacteroidetes bacterium]|nr:MAG: hypothetical protein D6714_00465 [Bacteroidota bacterium]
MCLNVVILMAQDVPADSSAAEIPCRIAVNSFDEFDSTRLITTEPVILGYLVPTKNLSEELDGKTVTEEAKAIFTYAEGTNRVRSFFLTLVVTEYEYLNIENGFTVFLKLSNGKIVKLYNVPDSGELNRDIIMWLYQHTCVVPLEVFHLLKNERIEKIRIVYENAKRTIILDEKQQRELQNAIQCVDLILRNSAVRP